jgi:hypothetical protein
MLLILLFPPHNSNKFITKEKNVLILDFKQYNKFTKMSYSSKLNENSKAKNAEIQAKTANSSEMNAIKVHQSIIGFFKSKIGVSRGCNQ